MNYNEYLLATYRMQRSLLYDTCDQWLNVVSSRYFCYVIFHHHFDDFVLRVNVKVVKNKSQIYLMY